MPSIDMSGLAPAFRANFAAADAVAGDVAHTFAMNFVIVVIFLLVVLVIAVVTIPANVGVAVLLALGALVVLYDAWRAGALYSGTVDFWREVRASV